MEEKALNKARFQEAVLKDWAAKFPKLDIMEVDHHLTKDGYDEATGSTEMKPARKSQLGSMARKSQRGSVLSPEEILPKPDAHVASEVLREHFVNKVGRLRDRKSLIGSELDGQPPSGGSAILAKIPQALGGPLASTALDPSGDVMVGYQPKAAFKRAVVLTMRTEKRLARAMKEHEAKMAQTAVQLMKKKEAEAKGENGPPKEKK